MSLSDVVLSSGRVVELAELRLSSTYDEVLESYPCAPINDRTVRALLRSAEDAFPTTPAHLVPPSRTFPDQTAGAFGPVELLPDVACVGRFRSTALTPDHDPVLYRSALTVVWFQTTPAVPSGERADPGLRAIAWEELARDHEL